METVQALMEALFNAGLVILIVATMFSSGLTTTLSALGKVFRNIWLLLLVLIVALVIRPLVGWWLAEVFALATPAYIAMLLLAAIGSITFPLVTNFMITGAGSGEDISLPVADLIKTVAFLQLVPFVGGICVRHWMPETAKEWNPPVVKVSGYALMIVIVLALLGSWRTILGLFYKLKFTPKPGPCIVASNLKSASLSAL
jgi:BASS family bile acid:Na+ symporter